MLFLANSAMASGNMGTLRGEVIAVDGYAGTFTVKSSAIAPSPDMQAMSIFTFTMDKMTAVTSCTQNRTLQDIGVGEKVEVRYHEKDGKLFADAIDIGIPIIVACNDE